jgi:hypothetical protein
MKRRITNNEMSRGRADVVLWRRLGCGLWFVVQTASLASDRRSQSLVRTLRAQQVGSPRTALELRRPSIHHAVKTPGRFNPFLILALVATVTSSAALLAQSAAPLAASGQEVTPAGDELTWPREFEDNGTKVDIYQPQIEKWDGTDFETRSAVAITAAGSNAPVYGVFWMKARADVDKAARIVTLNDIAVTKAMFPSVPELQSQYLALIRKRVPTVSKIVALDHLEASYAVSEAVKKARTVPVKNDPPRIIYSAIPSLLVLVDGSPALRPMPGLSIERVINSRALILKVGSVFYLNASDHWYQAVDVGGQWTLAPSPPASLEAAKQAAVANQNVDLMPSSTNAVTTTPAIFVSTVPAELIQTEGSPNLVPIEGTKLMQIQNSDNALFFYDPSQRYYVLISGRWFDAGTLEGPWKFVPYNGLPKDFAKIPPTHPKANVLVSVPGTPQAKEAVIANSIPQTATVQRSEAKLELTYDGAPQFRPIASTPLLYAINTATPVIEVDAHTYYSLQNGVWFLAASPTGPWVVATSAPAVIYGIPVSSPLHYVTYVQVYGSTPDVVYVGYTPGYLGTEVCPDHVVVYGTGYYYPPYLGSDWVGWPYTYGVGAGFADDWGIGYGFGFAAGEWLGTWWHPWWGPYEWGWRHHFDYDHVSLNHVNIYHHWEPGVVRAEHNYGFNAWNGQEWSRNWSSHFNPYSSRVLDRVGVAGLGAYHGNFHAHVPQAPIAPRTFDRPNFHAQVPSAPVASRALDQPNVYGGTDGSVYRYNPSGSLERNTGPAWHPAPAAPRAELQPHAFGRAMGEQRFNNFRSFGGGFSHSAGGFGHAGGGGHR